MGYGKSGMGGQHPIMKHMTKAGGGTGTKQSMSKNADIKYGGPVIDKFKSPVKHANNQASGNTRHHDKFIGNELKKHLAATKGKGFDGNKERPPGQV